MSSFLIEFADLGSAKVKKSKEDSKHGATQASSEPAVITMILNDNTYHEVSRADFERYRELYPAVDVMQELRKMAGWLWSNPKKRKTRSGIARFITAWLAKEQDKPGHKNASDGFGSFDTDEFFTAAVSRGFDSL